MRVKELHVCKEYYSKCFTLPPPLSLQDLLLLLPRFPSFHSLSFLIMKQNYFNKINTYTCLKKNLENSQGRALVLLHDPLIFPATLESY